MKVSGIGGHKVSLPVRNSFTSWIREKSYEKYVSKRRISVKNEIQYQNVDRFRLKIHDIMAFKITSRIQLATQLNLNSRYGSEDYQFVNYGPGGRYDTHIDFLGDDRLRKLSFLDEELNPSVNSGDRVATFMVYLSNVQLGGSTYFPVHQERNNAALGTAIFWKNLFCDGQHDFSSEHGSCPVIIGSKWITTKWILYHDNYRQVPCTLMPSDRSQE